MRSNCLKLVAMSMFLLGTSFQAQAATISLTPSLAGCGVPECLVASGPENSVPEILDILEGLIPGLNELYKDDVGGSESGSFASSYSTAYGVVGLDPASARISYTGGPFIAGTPIYALIKDGKLKDGSAAWYFFNISNWNGTDNIDFSGFYAENQDRISHVSLYAGASVPDGGSMSMLLGIALLGLAGIGRRML